MLKNNQISRINSFLNSELSVKTFPKIVSIEPTNLCQFDCIMCSRKKLNNFGEMNLDFLKEILENNKDIFKEQSVWFELAGEPLLHSKIGEFIKVSKKYIKKAKIITNGVLLKEKAEELIFSGLDEIVISVDSLNDNEFKRIKNPNINFNLEKLYENIKYFTSLKSDINIKCQFINFSNNLNENQIINTMKNIGVSEIIIKKLSNRCGKARLYFKSENNKACFYPWERIIITYNGTVGVCCHDLTTTLNMGNLKNDTILNIWNNDKFQELRKKHIYGNLENTACYNCSSKIQKENIKNSKENEFKFIKF